MAKIVKLMEPFEQLSGKVCQHSKFLINLGRSGVNKDQMWTGKRCNGRDLSEHPYSTAETQAKTRFKAVRLAVREIVTDPNKLSDAYDEYKPVRDNYKSFQSFLWKTECAKWNEENLVHEVPEEEPVA